MRCPLTAIIFALELTHEFNMMFPVMVAVFVAYAFTVLTMKRSILTEKVSRRGFHLSREYSVDPLEIIFVREVMRTNFISLSAGMTADELSDAIVRSDKLGQRLFPVLDSSGKLDGILTYNQILKLITGHEGESIATVMNPNPVTVIPEAPLRAVVNLMAENGLTRVPVMDPADSRRVLGLVALRDLLHARARNVSEERKRERLLRIRPLAF
jgi:CBS domain-containing protein